ncbi:restriction endonuclease [Chloroflexota bacterium]
MSVHIEVAVSSGVSTTEQGALLESLLRQVLNAMQYDAGKPIRITASEIDVPATHRVTGSKIYVECKGQRERIPAGVLLKLLGTVVFHQANEGWLVTTAPLTKDAEGFRDSWEQRPSEVRRTLAIYTPDRLIQLLQGSGVIVNPASIRSSHANLSDEWYLLVTNLGRYWGNVTTEGGIPTFVRVFEASTGKAVSDSSLLTSLSSTNTSLNTLSWLSDPPTTDQIQRAGEDILVEVAQGESWFDYRPSRPEHFVGRREILKATLGLFELVRTDSTRTRLFSVTSLSGWGKSSLAVKLRADCRNVRNRSKFFFFPVDVRAAETPAYVSLSLVGCFRAAIDAGFIYRPVLPLEAGYGVGALATDSIQDCLEQLRNSNKTIILFFDQFEEVLSKPQLEGLFDQLRHLALEVDSEQAHFALGFARKTDATIPQDHSAYFLWHQLSDRRYDLELPLFGDRDVSATLTTFHKELGQPLNPMLRTQLAQACQGYPWLLKKLCIHVKSLLDAGLSQIQVSERGLDVGTLFQRDLADLSAEQLTCLKEVARQAPTSFVELVAEFNPDVVASLIHKRLIVRSGDRLLPYWDIFGDYLRTDVVPVLPFSYLPGTEFSTFLRAWITIHFRQTPSVAYLATELRMTEQSVRNVLRDLGNFGLTERVGESIVSVLRVTDRGLKRDDGGKLLDDAAAILFKLLQSHVFTIALREVATDRVVTDELLDEVIRTAFSTVTYRNETWRVYSQRLAKYLLGVGILRRANGRLLLIENPTPRLSVAGVMRRHGHFLGDAPPARVLQLAKELRQRPMCRSEIRALRLRNAATVLMALRLTVSISDEISITGTLTDDVVGSLRATLEESSSFREALRAFEADPSLTGPAIGAIVQDQLGMMWSKTSCIRIGNALRQWIQWYTSDQPGAVTPIG